MSNLKWSRSRSRPLCRVQVLNNPNPAGAAAGAAAHAPQHTLRPPVSSAEGLFGGACLGVKGSDCVVFFDWDEGVMIRKIDVVPKEVGRLGPRGCYTEWDI